jgi:2-dehydropantoate 2-reductase
MKIAVIGVGAMGSIYAGLLADAGNEVWAIDLREDHLDAIREQGLRIEGASGDRVVRQIKVSTRAEDAGVCELIIIATKASGVESAARSICPLLGGDTLVLTIQNGLGAAERICQYLPPDNILLGIAGGFGASIKAPGHVHHNGMELIRVGEMHGGLTSRVERIVEVWREAGFTAKGFEDIQQLIWEKFICNVTFSASCTVFGRTLEGVMNDPHAWKIALGCGLEAYAVSQAKGVELSFSDPVEYITAFGRKMPKARPSMLLDHLDQRYSEIDAINGIVPAVASEVGLRAPYNEVVTAIVKSRETMF